MSSIEINKIAASVLLALIIAWASGLLASKLIEPKLPAKAAIAVANAPAAAPASSEAAAGPEPLGPLLASASVDAGKSAAKVCQTCHTFDKGGPNRVGPNLYGIVGDEIAHDRGGYSFSAALKSKGGTWTVDNLNEWLFKPQNFARGTKMTFVGMPKAKERADVIAFLNSLSDSPKPLTASQ
ncbi:MAG TPA: cytochrome c family protein [Stellaceae bacterium]|nr:cytochrome c family protein [Stellaceae bacterium]